MQRYNRPRILMVEDDHVLAHVLCRYLNLHGYDTHVAPDFHHAELALKEAYSMVLMELNIPGGAGFSLLQLALEKHPRVPVMVVSGMQQEHNVVRALDSGAVDFLPKPFSLETLLLKIQRQLQLSSLAS